MKKIVMLCSVVLMTVTASAQEKNKKTAFEVSGNCEMCKERIEKAAIKVKGVKYASWDIPSKQLSVIMDERKCSVMDVKKAVAAVGHDTKEVKAEAEVYKNLHPCCQYVREGEEDNGHEPHQD